MCVALVAPGLESLALYGFSLEIDELITLPCLWPHQFCQSQQEPPLESTSLAAPLPRQIERAPKLTSQQIRVPKNPLDILFITKAAFYPHLRPVSLVA